MPDGKHIVFGQQFSAGPGEDIGIWWVRSDGSAKLEELLAGKGYMHPTSISPDGKRIAFNKTDPATGGDIWTLPLDLSDPDHPKPGTPEPFLRDPGDQFDADFSPDGRWMAYVSAEAGIPQVFVRAFPGGPAAGRWQISSQVGGTFPIWSRTAHELFFLGPDNRIMVAGYSVKGDSFVSDKAREWSPTTILRISVYWPLDLASDGKRFVVFPVAAYTQGEDNNTVHVTVLLNFFDELRRRLP
jgi:serine/threonine-protein kinase